MFQMEDGFLLDIVYSFGCGFGESPSMTREKPAVCNAISKSLEKLSREGGFLSIDGASTMVDNLMDVIINFVGLVKLVPMVCSGR